MKTAGFRVAKKAQRNITVGCLSTDPGHVKSRRGSFWVGAEVFLCSSRTVWLLDLRD